TRRSAPSATRTAAARRPILASSEAVTRAGSSSAVDQVREQPVGAGHAGGQLTEEREPRVDEAPLAVLRDDERAVERTFARIGEPQDRRVALVPLRREVDAALLDPAREVGRRDRVRPLQEAVRGSEERGRRGLVGDAVAADLERERPERPGR